MVRNFVTPDLAKNELKHLPVLGSDSFDTFYPKYIKKCGYSHSKQATSSGFYRKECQYMLMKEIKFSCAKESSVRKPSMLENKIEIIEFRLNKKNIKLKMLLITELGVGVTMIVWGILKNI